MAENSTLGQLSKMGELKSRLLFLLGALIIFRLGSHIPVPGIDPFELKKLFDSQSGGILGMFNMFSGGALSRFTVFALGIMPYISASIIMTLLTSMSEKLKELKKEGQSGQRRITINYAKRQVGNKMYGGQSSHLPLKINQAGVIPAIFASSVILFPATIAGWFGSGESLYWLKDISAAISPGQPIYIIMFAVAIIFFSYFYTAITFNPAETADNLKKGGAFVPGIRPGEQTAKYIDTIMGRLTLIGSIYITLVCLLPELLILKFNTPFYFGGTSLLIIVVVTMDFMTQVQSQMMSYQYEGLLKKANFKGGSGGRL